MYQSHSQANHSAQPTIGAAIIVRDAESSIENALRSLKGFAKQIVVVDTGSVDSTPVLVSRMGAEIHFKKWENNFSKARNYALDLMRTDWTLVIDADEQLDTSTVADIQSLLLDEHLGGVQLRIVNALSETDETAIEHRYTRIFRNRPDIRFRGAVHEQVAESIAEAGLLCAQSELTIYHDGYRQVTNEKTKRNSTLLQAELEQHPDDVWTKYHLGLTEFSAGKLAESRAILESLLDSDRLSLEQNELAHIRCAQAALAVDDLLAVESLLQFSSADAAREGLRLYVLGAALSVKMNIAEALRCFVAAKNSRTTLIDQSFLAQSIEMLSSYLTVHGSTLDR